MKTQKSPTMPPPFMDPKMLALEDPQIKALITTVMDTECDLQRVLGPGAEILPAHGTHFSLRHIRAGSTKVT